MNAKNHLKITYSKERAACRFPQTSAMLVTTKMKPPSSHLKHNLAMNPLFTKETIITI